MCHALVILIIQSYDRFSKCTGSYIWLYRMAECAEAKTALNNQNNPLKTPVSTLQEYCQKLGKTPQYDLTALEGRAHQPQFVYRCMVGEMLATGQGSSKKVAKHAAAEAVLRALTNGLFVDEVSDASNLAVDYAHEVDDTNPVGSLQELVVARGWRLPEYSLAHETGPAHKKEFIICCTVESFKEYGCGSAKKHAKRLAASNMFTKIVNLPPEAKESITSQSREAKNKIGFNEICNSIAERQNFFMMRNEHAHHNPCEVLEQLANKHSFEANYKLISHTTSDNNIQCLVHLSTQPVCIIHGEGETEREAYTNAANQVLQYLSMFGEEADYIPSKLDKHTIWNRPTILCM